MKSKEYRNTQILANLVCGILALLALLPFILLIVASLTDNTWATANGFSFFPGSWSLDAYRYIAVQWATIGRAYLMTIVVTIIGTAASIMVTTLFAYAICQQEVPGMKLLSFMMVFTMLFNGGLVPTYIMWTQTFHIKNTIFALLVPNLLMGAFYVIMMRTYFSSNIPDAVIEAARIDGAGEMRILLKIVLPMSLPIIATLALLTGLGYWNDWLNGLYYIQNDSLYSIQVLLNRMLMDVQFLMSSANTAAAGNQQMGPLPSTGIKMAVAVLGALPALIIYPFFQKYFVKGITIGAVKG